MATKTATPDDGNSKVASYTYTDVTTSDVGGKIYIGNLVDVVVHVYSAGAGTAQLRGSNDGTNFINIGAALAANTLTALAYVPAWIDFNPIGAATVTITVKGRRVF